jgi:hypothetical protein
MLALVVSALVSAAAPAPAPSASVTCADGPASCDAAADWQRDGDVVADGPHRYATPAVIDCRAPLVPRVLQTLVGECDGTPRDASYRTSRYPESEQSAGSVLPAGRDRRPTLAACHGVPAKGGVLTIDSVQPLALFAVPAVALQPGDSPLGESPPRPRSRTSDPLERPPRA